MNNITNSINPINRIILDKDRCSICNRRLLLIECMIGKCKCNKLFCKLHRNHKCTFDFQKENEDRLKKSLPLIIAKKVQFI